MQKKLTKPEGAFLIHVQGKARQAETELEERLRRCDPILSELERVKANARSAPRSDVTRTNFEASQAREILASFLPVCPPRKNTAKKLARQAKYWRLSGKGGVWERFIGELYRVLPHRYSSKCPLRSVLVTALATYFWQCVNIHVFLSVPARYQYIGRIIEALATPACLMCGRKHTFRSWQAVQSLDDFKAERPPWKDRAR